MTRVIIYDILMTIAVLTILLLIGMPYIDLFIAFILILIYTYQKQGIKLELGFIKPQNWIKTLVTAIGLAIVIVLLSYFVLLPQIEWLTGHTLNLGMFEQLRNNTSLLITSLILGWVVGGLLEETIFRGFLISRFFKHLPHRIAVVSGVLFSSIIFGYLHNYQGPSGQVLTGFVGLMLGIVYVVNKRNIWLNILTHGFVNTTSMLFLYFDVIN